MNRIKSGKALGWASALAFAFVLGFTAIANAYQTQHVVVVVLDGARVCETFGDDPSLRPAYCPAWDGTSWDLVPGIMGTLAPQGSLGVQVFNTQSQPTTELGVAAIVAGKNTTFSAGKKPYYLKDPGAFEYIRKDLGLAQSDMHWYSKSLTEVTHYPWSKVTGYGQSYKPDETHSGSTDTEAYNGFKSMLLSQRPTYSLLHVWDIDTAGHANDWNAYTTAIATADGLMVDLWNSIQADSVLANTTALIVTNDHGRDCDPFTHHVTGDSCSRQVMLLALGPDFKSNYVSLSIQDTRTITPTIAELLGVTTPYADGTVFTDILYTPVYPNISVSNINVTVSDDGAHKHGVAVTTVLDETGTPVESAEVIGQWSGLASNLTVNSTDSLGESTSGSNEVTSDVAGDFVYTVTGVTATGYTYNPSGNAETTDQASTAGYCVASGGLCTPGLSSCCDAGQTCTGASGSETCQTVTTVEIHVSNIQVNCVKAGKNWRGDATISVQDASGTPVDGVSVTGQWSGAVSSSCSGITSGGGLLSCSSGNNKNGGTFTITVADLSLGGYVYNPAADVNNPNSCTAP